jgi:hypothetical protein
VLFYEGTKMILKVTKSILERDCQNTRFNN